MTKNTITSLLLMAGLAGGLALSSCVDPYATTTITTYTPGYRINTLPGGYRTEIIGGTTYYYHNGYYYRPARRGYVVVEAPHSSRYYNDHRRHFHAHGGHMKHGPGSHRSTGHRHARTGSDGRIITRLPNNARVVNHNGVRYYNHNGRYYRREGNGYITVNAPF